MQQQPPKMNKPEATRTAFGTTVWIFPVMPTFHNGVSEFKRKLCSPSTSLNNCGRQQVAPRPSLSLVYLRDQIKLLELPSNNVLRNLAMASIDQRFLTVCLSFCLSPSGSLLFMYCLSNVFYLYDSTVSWKGERVRKTFFLLWFTL